MSNANKLLRRALNSLNNLEDQLKDLGYGWLGGPQLREEIETFLDAEPEAEPVAWMRKWYFDGEIPRKEKNERGRMAWPNKFKFLPLSYHKCCEDDIPLYAKPSPARKPMTEEEIEKGMDVNALSHFEACAFASGIRFAEKHHGIGGDDNG